MTSVADTAQPGFDMDHIPARQSVRPPLTCSAYRAKHGHGGRMVETATLTATELSMAFALPTALIAGTLAGFAVAAISQKLPGGTIAWSVRRYISLALLCAFLAATSVIWSQSQALPPVVAVLTALLGWQLVLIGVVDFEHHWLPDSLTAPLFLTGLLASLILPSPPALDWQWSLVSAVAGFTVLWLAAFLYQKVRKQKGLGGGDPILMGAGCAWTGLGDLITVLLWACVFTLVIAVLSHLRRKAVSLETRLPFGTAMVIGFWLAWLSF